LKPTVTQLINLLDKPNLVKWANNLGLTGVSLSEYRQSKKGQGTNMHHQIQECILNAVPIEDAELSAGYNKFFEDKEILSCEENVETEYFVGRLDCRFKHNDNYYVADFKSGSGIYLNTKLQLTAYKMAYPNHQIGIIKIPNFYYKAIDIEFEKYKKILITLSNLYNHIQDAGEKL